MKRKILLLGWLLMLAGVAPAADDIEAAYDFALIGDTPYSDTDREHFITLLKALDREALAFVIHAGDFKSGSSVCSDAMFEDRLGLFNRSAHPFVYVPGDNDWTDCHRTSNGNFDPLERLARLRSLFFADNQTLGKTRFAVENQAETTTFRDYREHLRWQRGPVMFVTLNVPGSDNNFGPGPRPGKEFTERSRAVEAWLHESFTLARDKKLKGVVVVMQADPDFLHHTVSKPSRGYGALLQQLHDETRKFSGEVLLVHGDSHSHTIDQPLRDNKTGKPLENFTRVETYGYPFTGWVRVSVQTGKAGSGAAVFKLRAHPGLPQ